MAGIVKLKVGGRDRLYRTFSWRDENNYPQSNRKLIATIDQISGIPVFNKYFMNLVKDQGINIGQILSEDYKKIPSIVNFGTFNKLTKQIEYQIPNLSNNNTILGGKNNINEIKATNKSLNFADNLQNKINITISEQNTVQFDSYQYLVKDYGPHLLLEKILEDTGLIFVLKDTFPEKWQQIATLSYFLVCNNSPVMYCDDWVDNTVTYLNRNNLQSQRISELLNEITYDNVMKFYENWSNYIIENEYIALDITSISSYSQLMNLVEYGHNRDDENLPQINYCLLFGEKSGLPIFSSVYPGSINDVVSLASFIAELDLINNKSYKLVMDKGFHSKKNIDMFIKKYPSHKFLMSVPFTTSIAKQIVSDNMSKFDQEHIFRVGDDIILGYSFIKRINNNYSLKYHVFYNNDLNHRAIQNKIKDILSLQEEAKTDPEKFKLQKDYNKYLNFIKASDSTSYEVTINVDKIKKDFKNQGWMIIVGNDLDFEYKDVIKIYRSKDCVEKAFCRFKNMLDLRRLRTHSDKNSLNKIFIAFIAQIILSYIHKVMSKNNLYSTYTITETLNRLRNIKLMSYGEKNVLSPISKENKRILGLFGIKIE